MDERLQAALKYLSTPVGAFWKWMDDGKVVAWTHGATVAFREEVAAVLQRLAPRGLPPIDLVLLLIAATRIYWAEDSAALRQKLRGAKTDGELEDLLKQLDRIHNLPSDLRESLIAKGDLAELVFETDRPVISSEIATVVCEVLATGVAREFTFIPNLPRLRGGSVQTSKSLSRDLLSLRRSLSRVSERALRLRHQTGLDSPPAAADEVIIPAEPVFVRTLLQRLALDEDLCGLTRIARSLAAVLHLPRAITDSDELPLGGVSDISNRGTLDRLLLSELAHDDLMLATRVALNEALYLRRETPPSPPPERRHVLLDSGLRMWGVPRIYAAAAMLSLAANGSEGATLLAYRAAGSQVIPIHLSTKEGLVKHLEALEHDLHPGQALDEFIQTASQGNEAGEFIIVTSDAGLADPEFQRMLAETGASSIYLATVNRTGEFQLWSRGTRGTKLLTSLKLDLDELLRPPARTNSRVSLINPDIDPNLPAILRISPLPIRLPAPHSHAHRPDKEAIWSVRLPADRPEGSPSIAVADPKRDRYGVLQITSDRRLILFDAFDRGAIQLAAGMPTGKLLWGGSSTHYRLSFALIHQQSEPALYRVVVDLFRNRLVACSKLPSTFLSHGSQVLGATCHMDRLSVIYPTRIETFDLSEGTLLHQLPVPERLHWAGGRYFTDVKAPNYEEWRTLTCDANGMQFEPVRLRGPELTGRMLRLFDRPGHDGPFGVHLRGSIANLSNQTEWAWTTNARSNPKVIDIDENGDRLLIEQESDDWTDGRAGIAPRKIRRLLFTEDSASIVVPLSITSLAIWDLSSKNAGGQLMRRFSRIFVGPGGRPTLTSKTQTNRELTASNHRLLWNQIPPQKFPVNSVSFEQARHPDPGCTMMVATWKDGSRALLDSRGLLHLQSSDRSIAEATLVLTDRDVAVWISDGRVCGTRYFVDENIGQICTPQEFVNDVLNPFIERLR